MRIDYLGMQNFKKYATLEIEFHPKFTLLVGDNGAGKTTILDALAVAAGVWLVKPPDTILSNSGRNISSSSEIRLDPEVRGDRIQFNEKKPVVVMARGRIGDYENIGWVRQIRVGSTRTTNGDAEAALNCVQDIYSRDNAGERVLCPVLAYYGAGRAWVASNERTLKTPTTNGPARRWAAFYDCFKERIRFPELQKWFLGETLAAVNRGGRMRPGFEVVKRAILRCVPEADGLWYDGDRKQIILSIAGHAQPFDNLSAGQGMMLALIADLAIKAITQNAFLLPPDEIDAEDEPLPRVLRETPGVVLIDELDVHLHPKWQRRVATDLKSTFPNIQFICTSHSPQVIGEVHPDELRILNGHKVDPPPAQSFGMDSNWIIEVLMKGAECNQGVKNQLKHIFTMIEQKNLPAAEAEINKLRIETGNSERLQRAASWVDRIKILGK